VRRSDLFDGDEYVEDYEARRRRQPHAEAAPPIANPLKGFRLTEDNARLRGERLRREDVERARIESYRQVRAGVLAATSRIRSRLPHLSAADAVVIDEELRAALTALADVEDP
jgi:hypothetical protein